MVAETVRNAKDRLGICGGLDKNGSHRLMYLNTQSLGNGTIW